MLHIDYNTKEMNCALWYRRWNCMVSVLNLEPAIVTRVYVIFLSTFRKFLEVCNDRCLPCRVQFIICKCPLSSGLCIWKHVKWSKKKHVSTYWYSLFIVNNEFVMMKSFPCVVVPCKFHHPDLWLNLYYACEVLGS